MVKDLDIHDDDASLITHHSSSLIITHNFSPRAPPETLIKDQRKDGRELGQSSDSGASKLYKKSKWKHKRATHHGMLDFCFHLLPLSSYPTLQKQRNSSTSLYTRSVLLSTSIQHYLHFAQHPSAWPIFFFTLSCRGLAAVFAPPSARRCSKHFKKSS